MASAKPEQLTLDAFEKVRQDLPADLLMQLDQREQWFVCELLANPHLNRTIAAIHAGYPKKSAKQRAWEVINRPRVKEALDDAIRRRSARTLIDADRILREADTVSLSSIDHYRLTDDGNIELAPGAPPDAMRAVRSLKRRTRVIADRGSGQVETIYDVEFTLWGKTEALTLSMRHRGMLVDQHRVSFGKPVGEMTDEEIEAERRQLQGKK